VYVRFPLPIAGLWHGDALAFAGAGSGVSFDLSFDASAAADRDRSIVVDRRVMYAPLPAPTGEWLTVSWTSAQALNDRKAVFPLLQRRDKHVFW
jgi:hypothetical protein